MDRRKFLTSASLIGGSLVASRTARAATATIEILPDDQIGVINPNIYGQFIEHIGGVIYDGVWVGAQSDIPNKDGIRNGLLQYMDELKPPIVRWPGGCFADSYDWRDGIGPLEKRSARLNFWIDSLSNAPDGPSKFDPNSLGTDEFLRFCSLTAAKPYLAANVRSLSPLLFTQWVEYCNASSSLSHFASQRAENGHKQAYNVQYWGIGNESWGCGGEFTPREYASEFRRYTTFVPDFSGTHLRLIASGPNGDFLKPGLDWTRGFFDAMVSSGTNSLPRVYGWSLHYYCSTGSRLARGFPTSEWYDLLLRAAHIEALLNSHWSVMAEFDPAHNVKLVVDEWGGWHKQDQSVPASFLFGYAPSLRDALLSAIFLDSFQRNADKVAMTNVAQLVNNLTALFLAHGSQIVATPVYHVFKMYMEHSGGTSLRTLFHSPSAPITHKTASLSCLLGSASMKGSYIALTVVNTHLTDVVESEIIIRGIKPGTYTATTLTAAAMDSSNTFQSPYEVKPSVSDGSLGTNGVYRFPPASVTKLHLQIS